MVFTLRTTSDDACRTYTYIHKSFIKMMTKRIKLTIRYTIKSIYVCFSFWLCARLSCILSFRVHVKLFYRIVSYRTMSSSVAVIEHEHIDLTALFTYRTMSCVAATTVTQKLNESSSISSSISSSSSRNWTWFVQFLRQLSHDVVWHRAIPARHGNLHVKAAVRHQTTSSSVAESSDIVRQGIRRCRAQCEQ